ncbi:MAG: hypothetical protein CL566_08140 [Alphaproteobacteria bacterium]|nr:hypothetical protein [Alphaproteobacteria bacterium]|tara:strand:- start:662 stop:946 length:285 start_codon:yes stop_codon:yes gene_type:complete
MAPFLALIDLVLHLYTIVVIASVALTWLVQFNVINTSNRFVYQIGDFLYRITEPVLGKIRTFVPAVGGIDLSPIVLLIAIWFVRVSMQHYLGPF